jgi:succinate dehydrogenase / fumarate reductase membrane anchor subunit
MKVSSIVLLLLAPFFMAGLVHLATMPFGAARVWLAHPVRGLVLLAYLLVSLWHSYLGLRVVIEDYVHCPKAKLFSLLSLKVVHGVLMLVAAYTLIVLAAKF